MLEQKNCLEDCYPTWSKVKDPKYVFYFNGTINVNVTSFKLNWKSYLRHIYDNNWLSSVVRYVNTVAWQLTTKCVYFFLISLFRNREIYSFLHVIFYVR